MKNIFNFRIILFILPVFLFTCEDKLDDEQELVVLSDEIDYTSEEGAFGALIGAYEKLQIQTILFTIIVIGCITHFLRIGLKIFYK